MTIGPAYGAGGADRARMLASSADRDRAVDFLKTAFAEGRLSPEEYEARMSRGLAARTYADLDALTADLPGARPPAPPGTNPLAITSMICGIAQFALGFLVIATIPALVCGYVARRQIRQTGEEGSGMATAGIILGWVGAGITVLLGIIVAVAAIALIHAVTPQGT